MATYLLVHGGGGGWVWTLTGVGERAHLLRPDTDLETHIADILPPRS